MWSMSPIITHTAGRNALQDLYSAFTLAVQTLHLGLLPRAQCWTKKNSKREHKGKIADPIPEFFVDTAKAQISIKCSQILGDIIPMTSILQSLSIHTEALRSHVKRPRTVMSSASR